MFRDCPSFTNDDDFMTPKSAWEDISVYLPRNKVIWECFYGDGRSGGFLKELGFDDNGYFNDKADDSGSEESEENEIELAEADL